ncbi:hypothetical protein [Mangrovimonas sp. DI 80]|uniref:hypothetical protein n=1 Tax=Mangrovimonas sp. DI 80 TaxID=1779330 RepID=UPI000975E9F2|nr:hypothetical protein [Mangrovimonas sp. DI 80]OMP32590.1 hypothetical protein BKM32_05985 [Mangrovimonas sp. DI 80]
MKPYLFTLTLLVTVSTFAQDGLKNKGLFYKFSLAATLRTNSDYVVTRDDGNTLIQLNGLFINNSLGYQFDRRASVALNVEYDHYFKQSFNFMPVYATFRYNVLDFDDRLFLRAGYGKLFDMGAHFENGTMYKAGIGIQTFDANYRNSWLFGLDFSRKRFGYRQEEKLSSVAIFIEFMLF